MDKLKPNRRLLLAGMIVFITLYSSLQNHQAQNGTIQETSAPNTSLNSERGNTPSTPFVWIVGSSLLGLVGLKRFGLNRG
ncbi:MAG TPA: hypothetical protein ENJ35_02410 [Gammaproteobacteria bacterium]|nr:hypothetical protein [Gammaproteobacteria bacterium]